MTAALPADFTRRRLFVLGAATLATGLAGCERSRPVAAPAAPFRGTDITGADYARTLSLPDVDGKPRTLADFKGKFVVVFFGYTQCPDVCPTTMVELAQAKKALGAEGARLQGIFITIDPERDTPEILKSYITSFDPSFVALRGTLAQTEAAAKSFKVSFAKVAGKVAGSYTMDHTAGAFILDANGNPRLFERYGGGSDALLNDIRTLMAAA